ncbi:MAG TPA: hypothetical protein VHT91_49705 [Kofleriaceae bacterium]|nr:hypothetical protein [Kofleriaceae bacterium]
MAKINLADPSFEPTDEQLAELFKRAFADVARRLPWSRAVSEPLPRRGHGTEELR